VQKQEDARLMVAGNFPQVENDPVIRVIDFCINDSPARSRAGHHAVFDDPRSLQALGDVRWISILKQQSVQMRQLRPSRIAFAKLLRFRPQVNAGKALFLVNGRPGDDLVNALHQSGRRCFCIRGGG